MKGTWTRIKALQGPISNWGRHSQCKIERQDLLWLRRKTTWSGFRSLTSPTSLNCNRENTNCQVHRWTSKDLLTLPTIVAQTQNILKDFHLKLQTTNDGSSQEKTTCTWPFVGCAVQRTRKKNSYFLASPKACTSAKSESQKYSLKTTPPANLKQQLLKVDHFKSR